VGLVEFELLQLVVGGEVLEVEVVAVIFILNYFRDRPGSLAA
jgi:hypothetical protein